MGTELPHGKDYYKLACNLTEDQAEALNAADTAWTEGRAATRKLDGDDNGDCKVTSKTKAISFVYPESDAHLTDWGSITHQIQRGTGASAGTYAYADTYNFLPSVAGYHAGEIAVLEWMAP